MTSQPVPADDKVWRFDVVAGLTAAAVVIPKAMAYAAVAGLPGPAPTAPDNVNWLGTDDNARDVLARVIYGFRISVLFGLVLTITSTVIGVLAGAVQGFYGGWVDLSFQRFLEIWGGLPFLYVLLILSSVIEPGFWTLLGIMLLVSWTWPVGVVPGAATVTVTEAAWPVRTDAGTASVTVGEIGAGVTVRMPVPVLPVVPVLVSVWCVVVVMWGSPRSEVMLRSTCRRRTRRGAPGRPG